MSKKGLQCGQDQGDEDHFRDSNLPMSWYKPRWINISRNGQERRQNIIFKRKLWNNLVTGIWKEERSHDFEPGWPTSKREGLREKNVYIGKE